jgi:hypothetical protein
MHGLRFTMPGLYIPICCGGPATQHYATVFSIFVRITCIDSGRWEKEIPAHTCKVQTDWGDSTCCVQITRAKTNDQKTYLPWLWCTFLETPLQIRDGGPRSHHFEFAALPGLSFPTTSTQLNLLKLGCESATATWRLHCERWGCPGLGQFVVHAQKVEVPKLAPDRARIRGY